MCIPVHSLDYLLHHLSDHLLGNIYTATFPLSASKSISHIHLAGRPVGDSVDRRNTPTYVYKREGFEEKAKLFGWPHTLLFVAETIPARRTRERGAVFCFCFWLLLEGCVQVGGMECGGWGMAIVLCTAASYNTLSSPDSISFTSPPH